MSQPLVSIFVPTYEPRPEHLHAALDSVLAQSDPRWELFIHDDASNVDVENMVRPYLRDKRVTFKRSPRRLGIGGNWNACLQLGKAPYVQYLFQDDQWHRDYLQTNIAVLEADPSIGFTASNHEYAMEGPAGDARKTVYEDVLAIKREHLRPGRQTSLDFIDWWSKRGLRPNVIGEPSFVMLRRELTERIGRFSENMPQCLDLEYWLRALLRTDWYYIDNDLGSFRVHAAAASARNDESGLGLFDRLRCFDVLLNGLPRGPVRRRAQRSFQLQIADMAQRFFARAKSGKKVSGGGSTALVGICMKHPVLVMKGIVGYVRRKR